MQISSGQAAAMGPAGSCQECQPPGPPPAASEPTPPSVAIVDPEKPSWIVVELLSDEGRPMVGERVLVQLPDGSSYDGALDKNGRLRIEGIDAGSCRILFPERDGRDWRPA